MTRTRWCKCVRPWRAFGMKYSLEAEAIGPPQCGPISQDTRPVRRPGVLFYRALDEMVIYDPTQSCAAALSASSRAIWELCDGTRTTEQICVELAQAYGMLADQLREDVTRALERLCELNLLNR
jgi:hypothetical protein